MKRNNAAVKLPPSERLYICPELAERLEALVQATGEDQPESGAKRKRKAQPPPLGDFGKTIYVWRALDLEMPERGASKAK